MAQDGSTFNQGSVTFFFQSRRAGIDGKAASPLVDLIKRVRRSLDVSIYDLKERLVLDVFARIKDVKVARAGALVAGARSRVQEIAICDQGVSDA
jgi:hypothetical protein